MSCRRKRIVPPTDQKPINTEQVQATAAKLAEMIAERERQDRELSFTRSESPDKTNVKEPLLSIKTKDADGRRG